MKQESCSYNKLKVNLKGQEQYSKLVQRNQKDY